MVVEVRNNYAVEQVDVFDKWPLTDCLLSKYRGEGILQLALQACRIGKNQNYSRVIPG